MASGTDNREPGEERDKKENDEVFDPEQHRFDPSLNRTPRNGESDTDRDLRRTRVRPEEPAGERGAGVAGSGSGASREPGTPGGPGDTGSGTASGETTQRTAGAYGGVSHSGYSGDAPTYGGQGRTPAAYEPAWQAAEAAVPAPKRRRFTVGWFLKDVIVPLVIAFAVAMFVQATVAKPYKIPSGSMLPTIQLGDRILADRMIYHFKDIQRGDIIVFEPPTQQVGAEPGVPFVKRVIGLPGDTVQVTGGKTLVNGEEYVVPEAEQPSYNRKTETVPEGMLFVLGDNRNESSDSHIWGFVPIENVIGRVELIYWPLDHLNLI